MAGDGRKFDIVSDLKRVPFGRRSQDERWSILNKGRPVVSVQLTKQDGVGKAKTRSFSKLWYQKADWLCGSRDFEALFCWPCTLLSSKRSSWNTTGFSDLKNFSRGIASHSGCTDHIRCDKTLKKMLTKQPSIDEMLGKQRAEENERINEDVRKNREIFKRMIDATVMLSLQEQALQGHHKSAESDKGGYQEFLECVMQHDRALYDHWKSNAIFSGESKAIQNELIQCIHDELWDLVKEEIHSAMFLSIEADELTDAAHHSQLAIIIRYVDSHGDVQERLLRLIDVSERRDAETVCNAVVESLEEFDMHAKLIGQTYNSTSVMSEEISGVQARIQDEAPHALFTHCHAGRLNEVLRNSAKSLKKSRMFFCLLAGISDFFSRSSGRTVFLESVLKHDVPHAVPTRWNSNAKIVLFVRDHFSKLLEVFQSIRDDPSWDDETVGQAMGFIHSMQSTDFAFLLHLYGEIFEYTDVVFNQLQRKNLDIGYSAECIRKIVAFLESLDTDESFKRILEKSGNVNHQSQGGRDMPEQETSDEEQRSYVSMALKHFARQLTSRFKDLDAIQFVELGDSSRFSEYARVFPETAVSSLEAAYPGMFDIQRLKNELRVMYEDEDFLNKSVDRTIKELLSCGMQSTFSEAYKLFCLIVTIPCTSVATELSCMTRIKRVLRNTGCSEHLECLMKISVERQTVKKMAHDPEWYNKIISRFIAMKSRRINLTFRH